MTTFSVADIKVGTRHRRELGDVDGMMRSTAVRSDPRGKKGGSSLVTKSEP
jgi:hypothetical protein